MSEPNLVAASIGEGRRRRRLKEEQDDEAEREEENVKLNEDERQ